MLKNVKYFTEIGYNECMDFHEWINKKFIEWRGPLTLREGGSQEKYAEWIGVSSQLMTDWLKRDGKIPKHQKTITKLVDKYGPKVYDVLGLTQPDIIPFDQLPFAVRDRLTTAVYEVNSELESRGLSNASPEAEDITIKIFEKHGFKYTRTTKK